MVQAQRSVGPSRLPLVALLGQLGGDGAPAPRPDFADTLGQWLGWTEAIALAAALEAPAAAAEPDAAAPARAGGTAPRRRPGEGGPPADDAAALLRDVRRQRLVLEAAIEDEADGDASASPAGHRGRPAGPVAGPAPAALDPAAEFTVCRHRYLAQRQRIEQAVAGLRARLRAALARRGPAAARLAAVDAVMERAIGAQEQRLLALLPAWLEQQFRRRLQGGGGRPGAPAPPAFHAGAPGPAADRGELPPPVARVASPVAAVVSTARPAWLEQYEADQRAVLRAELDLRFLPVEALLEALHPAPTPAPPAVRAPDFPPTR